jgi:putative hemolysin
MAAPPLAAERPARAAAASPRRARLARRLGGAARALLRGLGLGPRRHRFAPEEQVKILMKQGAESGVFEQAEHEMVRRVFRLGDRRAGALMTPMKEVVWLDVSDPPELMQRKIRESPHSQFPVCEGSIDSILGVVRVKDLLTQSFDGQPFSLKGLLMMPLLIFEGTAGLKVLEMFKQTGTHIAVVLNEYGSVVGLLTLKDILEAIVGDLPTGDASAGPRAVRRPDGSWLLDGKLPLDELREVLGLPDLPAGDYRTLAGFLVSRLGHIPRAAESLDWGGLRFEVVEMDGHRVDKVAAAPAPAP